MLPPTLARVRATLILCQSPSKEEVQALEFSLDRTKDNNMQSLSLPCSNNAKCDVRNWMSQASGTKKQKDLGNKMEVGS